MSDQPISLSTLQAEMWVTHSVLAEIIKSSGLKIDWAEVQMRVADRLAQTANGASLDFAKKSLKNIKEWSEN